MRSPTLVNRMLWTFAAAGLLLAGLMVAGCAKKSPAPQTPPPVAPPVTPPSTTPPTPPPTPPPNPDAGKPPVTVADLRTVYFALDSSTLDDAAKATLDADAKLLRDNATWKVKVEGHCDERGTVEYNQALGQRRADAAREYLAAAGVPGGQMQSISYGKEMPAVDGHDESAWSKNRRVQFSKQ